MLCMQVACVHPTIVIIQCALHYTVIIQCTYHTVIIQCAHPLYSHHSVHSIIQSSYSVHTHYTVIIQCAHPLYSHHTVCTPHHTVCTPHHTVCTPHHTVCIPHRTVCTPHRTVCTPHHTVCIPLSYSVHRSTCHLRCNLSLTRCSLFTPCVHVQQG